MQLVGRPEIATEPWFATGSERAQHSDLLDGIVGDWIGARTRDEVMAAFTDAGAAVAPVYSPADIVADPQVQDRKMLIHVDDEDLGTLLQHNVLYRMSATPGAIRSTGRRHGADTDHILAELGLTEERISTLRATGVVA